MMSLKNCSAFNLHCYIKLETTRGNKNKNKILVGATLHRLRPNRLKRQQLSLYIHGKNSFIGFNRQLKKLNIFETVAGEIDFVLVKLYTNWRHICHWNFSMFWEIFCSLVYNFSKHYNFLIFALRHWSTIF